MNHVKYFYSVPDLNLLWKNCGNAQLKFERPDFPSDLDDILISQEDINVKSNSGASKIIDPVEESYWKTEAEKYKCSKCSKTFQWKHHLIQHLKVSCGGIKSECCPFCDYRTDRKWNLKSHMKRRHNVQ